MDPDVNYFFFLFCFQIYILILLLFFKFTSPKSAHDSPNSPMRRSWTAEVCFFKKKKNTFITYKHQLKSFFQPPEDTFLPNPRRRKSEQTISSRPPPLPQSLSSSSLSSKVEDETDSTNELPRGDSGKTRVRVRHKVSSSSASLQVKNLIFLKLFQFVVVNL